MYYTRQFVRLHSSCQLSSVRVTGAAAAEAVGDLPSGSDIIW